MDVEISSGSWERMEHRLVLSERESGVVRSRSPFWKYAAAAVVLLAAGLGVYKLGTSSFVSAIADSSEVRKEAVYNESATLSGDILLEETRSSAANVINSLIRSSKAISVQDAGAGSNILANTIIAASEGNINVGLTSADMSSRISSGNKYYNPFAVEAAYRADNNVYSDAYYYGDHSKLDKFKRKSSNRTAWTVSGHSGTFPSVQRTNSYMSSSKFLSHDGALSDINGTRSISDLHGLKHSLPISAGFMVKKNITDRFSISTGLIYSYLESSAKFDEDFSYDYTQKLHYLGIPVSLNYSVWKGSSFDFYLTGGIMAEKALSAKSINKIYSGNVFQNRLTSNLKAKGLLWSANAGVGMSYDFYRNFGIFLEATANYYIPNRNHPESYRTANPWSINAKLGFSYRFN